MAYLVRPQLFPYCSVGQVLALIQLLANISWEEADDNSSTCNLATHVGDPGFSLAYSCCGHLGSEPCPALVKGTVC